MDNIAFVPQIDNALKNIDHRLDRIHSLAQYIKEIIEKTLKEGSAIRFVWNKNTKYESFIMITPHSKIDEIPIEAEDGFSSKIFYLPLGEIKLDLLRLAEYVDIYGEINIAGEPIIGLKIPDDQWLKNKHMGLQARFKITLNNGLPILTKDYVSDSVSWLSELNNTILYQLHIGLSKLKTQITTTLRPIYLRTIDYPHFWILDKKHKTYYELVLKQIEIQTPNNNLLIPHLYQGY